MQILATSGKLIMCFLKTCIKKVQFLFAHFMNVDPTDLYVVGLFNSLATNCKQNEYSVEQ